MLCVFYVMVFKVISLIFKITGVMFKDFRVAINVFSFSRFTRFSFLDDLVLAQSEDLPLPTLTLFLIENL